MVFFFKTTIMHLLAKVASELDGHTWGLTWGHTNEHLLGCPDSVIQEWDVEWGFLTQPSGSGTWVGQVTRRFTVTG